MVLRACGQAWVGWEALVGDENLLLHSSTLLYSRLHIQEESTVDFTYKKNTLWAKRDEHSDFSTANDRMQPAFAGSYKTVAIPLGSRVTGYLPREHPLVKNGSFGDRLLKVYTFVPITTRRAFACIVSPQDLNSSFRISNHILMNYPFGIRRACCGVLQPS